MTNTDKGNLDKALKICRKYVKKLDLPMNILSAEYNSKERKILFKFESTKRVDFRELLKILQKELSFKIELRQVGPRDKAKEMGGIGPCGEICCCKRFLNHFESISVKLIKKQKLPCSPQKYTGYCGKLMCCLKYEDIEKGNNKKTNSPKQNLNNSENRK